MSLGHCIPWGAGYLAVVLLIIVVDGWLGATAEYLNAYEIVRQTFAGSWPEVAPSFLWRGRRWGEAALVVGWLAFLLEALLVETLLYLSWRALRAAL